MTLRPGKACRPALEEVELWTPIVENRDAGLGRWSAGRQGYEEVRHEEDGVALLWRSIPKANVDLGSRQRTLREHPAADAERRQDTDCVVGAPSPKLLMSDEELVPAWLNAESDGTDDLTTLIPADQALPVKLGDTGVDPF